MLGEAPHRHPPTRGTWDWSQSSISSTVVTTKRPYTFRNLQAVLDLSIDGGGAPLETLTLSPASTWLPEPPNSNFTPPTVDQHYRLEIWWEKTTVDDVLLPLARMLQINIVRASGETSVTQCHALIMRAIASQRPARILLVTDFDPAGRLSIPVAAARKIEFLIRRGNLGLDVQVRPVALTHEQCVEYDLPRSPLVKRLRAASFEARFGEGVTELDPIEALHPGELRRILVKEIERYYDHDLDAALEVEADNIRAELADIRETILAKHADRFERIEAIHHELIGRCNAELKALEKSTGNRLRRSPDGSTPFKRPSPSSLTTKRRMSIPATGRGRRAVRRTMILFSILHATMSSR